MKKLLLLAAVAVIGCINTCFGMQLMQKFEKFTQKYAPPKGMTQLLDEQKTFIKQEFIDTAKKGEFSGIFIKGREVSRVVNAERMRACMRENNLDCLGVPKKYMYNLDGNFIVIAQCVRYEKKPLELQLKEVQQLATLAEETGYVDWKLDIEGLSNWVRSYSGKLICLDTEDLSFLGTKECKAFCVEGLLSYPSVMTEESVDWLKDRVDFLEKVQQ